MNNYFTEYVMAEYETHIHEAMKGMNSWKH